MRIIIRLVVLIILVILPISALGQGGADEARKHLVRGATAIEMATSPEDLALAIEEFSKATAIAPNMSAAWYNLGEVQAKSGKFKEAISSYNRYLLLAPQSADAQKTRDKIIKLEFRLEQIEKFKSLSGQWISGRGDIALVTAGNGMVSVLFPVFGLGIEYDYSMDGERTNKSPLYGDKLFELKQRGGQYVGIFETFANKPGLSCMTPPQKSEVVATVQNDQIVMKWPWVRFRVVESFGSLFDPEFDCKDVSPMGTLNVEVVLRKLPAGGIAKNSEGLQPGDVIVSIDGTVLETLNEAERHMKFRGQPGTTVQLVVKRETEKAGVFSSAKYTTSTVTVPLIDAAYDRSKPYYGQSFFW